VREGELCRPPTFRAANRIGEWPPRISERVARGRCLPVPFRESRSQSPGLTGARSLREDGRAGRSAPCASKRAEPRPRGSRPLCAVDAGIAAAVRRASPAKGSKVAIHRKEMRLPRRRLVPEQATGAGCQRCREKVRQVGRAPSSQCEGARSAPSRIQPRPTPGKKAIELHSPVDAFHLGKDARQVTNHCTKRVCNTPLLVSVAGQQAAAR